MKNDEKEEDKWWKTKEQRRIKQEVRSKEGFTQKMKQKWKNDRGNFRKRHKKDQFLEDMEMKETSWEEGSQEKWDQEQKRSRKNEIKKWSEKENWDQETRDGQKKEMEKRGQKEQKREKKKCS